MTPVLHRSRNIIASAWLALALTFGSTVLAQSTLPQAAEEALVEGELLVAEALATYPSQYPDRPLWQAAFEAGRRAAGLAPDRLEPVHFLARAYTLSHWIGPAWSTWEDYLRRGGVLNADDQDLVASVGKELGYGAYERGDVAGALQYYLRVTDLVPQDAEAHVWAGRILVENERPAESIPFWEQATRLDPSDDRSAYFLDLAREQSRWGSAPVNVFREGVNLYEAGQPTEASERFARAVLLNPDYPTAWAWLGRVAFEAGNYADAGTYYANAVRLEPGNETYRYFLNEAGRLAGGAPVDDED